MEQTLRAQLGDLPQIGWLVPPGMLLAEGNRAALFVLGPAPGLLQVSSPTLLSPGVRDSVRRAHSVACETVVNDSLVSSYQWPLDVREPRVLVTSRPFRDSVVSGFAHPPLSQAQLEAGRRTIDPGKPVRWRDSTFAVASAGAFFAVHAAYDSASGELVRSVLYLVSERGTVVGRRVLEASDHVECEGCDVPKYDDGFGSVYRILNVFRLPGFAHPVLLIVERNTDEVYTLSLITVTPQGAFSVYRAFEQVSLCLPDH